MESKMGRAVPGALIFIVFFWACTKDKTSPANCPTCSAISFKNEVIPIFTANCALPGCHITATSANHNVALDSAHAYASITQAGTGYVVAGNPDYSVLLGQLYPGASLHMPNNGGQLDACAILTISCWIKQGALNN